MQNFMQSYLVKKRCVISGIVYSNFAEVEYGVLQELVLEPLISLVYMNDRDDCCCQNCLTLYADDIVVKKGESTTEALSQSLIMVSDYLTELTLLKKLAL